MVFALAQPGRVDTHTTTVDATCPAGHTQQPDRSCSAPAATVRGLAGTYRVEVDTALSVDFTHQPAAAVVTVASVAPEGLTFTLADRASEPTWTARPRWPASTG